VGKVIKVPDPTRPLITPAPKPATTIKIASESGTEKPYLARFQDL
jgi:hypothetical protein